MKNKSLILKIITLTLSCLTFVSLFFPFVVVKTAMTNKQTISFMDNLNLSGWQNYLKVENSKIWIWQLSNILMIITLILIGLIMVVTVLKFFIEKDILNKVCKYLSASVMLLASAFIIFFITGAFSQATISSVFTTFLYPHIGPMLLGIFAILASVSSFKTE